MLITHATSTPARFLGYGVLNQQANHKRRVNGKIGLRVSYDMVQKKCAAYMRAGKPTHRADLLAETDYSIVARYQQDYRGLVQYYLLAHNVADLSEVHWVMERSLLKTLAAKHHTTAGKMRAKYRTTTHTPEERPFAVWKCACPESTNHHSLHVLAAFRSSVNRWQSSMTRPLCIRTDVPKSSNACWPIHASCAGRTSRLRYTPHPQAVGSDAPWPP